MPYQQQEQLQKQAIDLIVKAISAQVGAASEQAGKEMAAKVFPHVHSERDLARVLGTAFVEGATYVFKQMA